MQAVNANGINVISHAWECTVYTTDVDLRVNEVQRAIVQVDLSGRSMERWDF